MICSMLLIEFSFIFNFRICSVDGYILHAADSAVPAGANAGSAGENTQTDNKSQGFTNVYESYELTVSQTVSGNQASHDKYFKINVKIENAPANAVFNVSILITV